MVRNQHEKWGESEDADIHLKEDLLKIHAKSEFTWFYMRHYINENDVEYFTWMF